MADTMDDATKAAFKEAFSTFDKNGDGTVDQAELHGMLDGMGITTTGAELRELLSLMDTSKDGKVDFNEFLTVMAAKMSSVNAEEYVKIAYDSFDKDGDGSIGPEDLKEVFGTVESLKGLLVTEAEIAQVIEFYSSSTKLSKTEFTGWMSNP